MVECTYEGRYIEMRVFHYTVESAIKNIFAGLQVLPPNCCLVNSTPCYGKNGLLPIGKSLGDKVNFKVPKKIKDEKICALFAPSPPAWINNPKYPKAWMYIMEKVCREEKIYLLSFETLPSDDIAVADRAYIEDYFHERQKSEHQAYINYFHSLVPIAEYRLKYVLPEIHIFNEISVERLRIEDGWPQSRQKVLSRYSKE